MRRGTVHIFIACVSAIIFCVASSGLAQEVDLFSEDGERIVVNPVSEDNILLTEVRIGPYNTGETIEVYQHADTVLVPLGLLTLMLDFPVKLDIANRKAEGWFIREDRTFVLDIESGQVQSGDRQMSFSTGVVPYATDFYVEAELFAEWFPLDVRVDYARLVLFLDPKEPLPIQERLGRESKRKGLARVPGKEKKRHELLTRPYQFVDMPFVDADLAYDFDDNNEEDIARHLNYAVSAQGDLAFLTGHTYMSGNSTEQINNLRVSLGRSDPYGGLLGSMKATRAYIGDISGFSLPLAVSSGRGTGMLVTNRPLYQADQFDKTTFSGESLPGWEVELYRNDILIKSVFVPENGIYEFKDIDIFFGKNEFRIVEYGPQGQIRERKENFLIDDTLLKAGTFHYFASLDDKGKTTFGVDEKDTELQHPEGGRWVVGGEYGITDSITAVLGMARTPLEDGVFHEYFTSDLRASFFGVLANANYAYDYHNETEAAELALHTQVKGINLRGQHTTYNSFNSELERTQSSERLSESRWDINGFLRSILPGGLNYRLGGRYERFVGRRKELDTDLLLSTSWHGINATSRTEWDYNLTEGEENTLRVDGNFALQGRIKKFTVKADVDYKMLEERKVEKLNVTVQRQFPKAIHTRLDIRKNYTSDRLMDYGIGLNKRFGHFRLGGTLRMDTDRNISFNTQLSMALGRDPYMKEWHVSPDSQAANGAVSTRAFLDENYNAVLDKGDHILPDVRFRSESFSFTRGVDEPKRFVSNITPYEAVNVYVDPNSIEDPFWVPAKKGFTVETRPGSVVRVDYPIIRTTEIDGTVFWFDGLEMHPLPGVTVQLINVVNGEIIKETKSEYDGFFLFDRVQPGDFIVRMANADMVRFAASHTTTEHIIIKKIGDYISNLEIVAFVADAAQPASDDWDLELDGPVDFDADNSWE